MMKKILSIFIALVLICTLFSINVFAASASFTLSASGSVTVGNQVKVTVKLTSAENIGSWRFSVSYDPAILEYVSGGDSGGGGAVSFADSSDGTKSLSKTITFRAKKIGTVSVAVGSAQVVSFDTASNMTVNAPSRKISVVAAPDLSGENHLTDLSVSAGTLNPAFAADTNAYTVDLPYETTSLSVFATTKDTKATVSVAPSDALVVGENKIEVVVTAEDGSKRTYTITVNRAESELAGVTVDLDGTTYTVAYDPAALTIPENYTASTAEYGEKKILVFNSPKDVLQIAYLQTETDGAWYVYDAEQQSFSEYLSASNADMTVVLLTPDESVSIPEGFLPYELAVGEKKWNVYKSEISEEEGIWLVYGMKPDGTCAFFYYDSELAAFSSYFEPAVDTSALEEAEEENAILESLLKESEEKADQMEIMFLSATAGAILLFVLLIVSLATRKKTKQTKGFDAKEKNQEAAPEMKNESVEENVDFAPVAPKKRTARRTISEIDHKEEESSQYVESAPAKKAEEPKTENKKESNFSGDDIPTILR